MPKRTATWAWPTGNRAASRRQSESSRRRCGSTPTTSKHTSTWAWSAGYRVASTRRSGSIQAALRINPNDADADFYLGVACCGKQGRTEEAIRAYQAALRINPDLAEAHYSLGLAYGQQGRTDEAIREYQAALRINPDHAEAHYNLGVAYAQGRTGDVAQTAGDQEEYPGRRSGLSLPTPKHTYNAGQ